MTEKDIEKYLVKEAKRLGGKAWKWVSPGNVGVPDRIVMLPGGRLFFMELKAPGKKSTPMQKMQQQIIINLGLDVYADIDSREKIDGILKRGVAE